jgi:flavin-dependent dehydrogenase
VEHLLAKLVIDCTGKEAFASVREGWRVGDPYLNKVAVWTYYKGSKREPGIDEGQTTIAIVPEKGWFWHIPQHDDMVSVGVVAEGKYLTRDGVRDPKQMFHREIEENQWIKEHLSQGQHRRILHHQRILPSLEALALAGPAARRGCVCFLDPVFSSG